MKSSRRKRRRGRSASTQTNGNGVGGANEEKNKEDRDLRSLAEAFSLVSLDDVSAAYRDAEGDVNKAADILGGFLVNGDDPSAGSSSSERFMDSTSSSERFFESTSEDPPTSSNLSSCSSERFSESELVQNPNRGKGFGGSKQKRVVACTGMVSSVLGKSYVSSSPIDGGKQYNSPKWKGHADVSMGNEEAENFLFSMLGYGSELSMAVVRDVFSQCGYDVEKASDVLLDLSGSSFDDHKYGNRSGSVRQDPGPTRYKSPGTVPESSLTLFENGVQEILQSWDPDRRFYSEVLASSPKRHSQSMPETTEPNLPQKILDSLFKIPKSSEAKPGSMNWKNVVKKIESLGERMDSPATGAADIQVNMEYAKGEEYHVFREAARQHWQTMRSYFQKAATAYSRGNKDYAAYLSEQGRAQNKMAREADEKASKDIFEARNKEIQNVVTIDLHGQHVEQAMRVLKIHLLFMKCTSSVQILRVITGCGSHGFGKGKLKQEVINLAQKAGVDWSEENQGTILIKLHGRHAWSLADFESDSE